jgi:hypothetical protein
LRCRIESAVNRTGPVAQIGEAAFGVFDLFTVQWDGLLADLLRRRDRGHGHEK